MMDMDINSTGRIVHALAALRDAEGDVQQAASRLGISEETLRRAIAEGGATFFEEGAAGTVKPTAMGSRFADRADTFPYVNW